MFFKRLFHIIWIILSVSFKRKLTGPERLRLFFERTGGAFVKFGQILALRQDFLPFSYVKELLKFLNKIPPTPYREIQKVFAEEKGISPEVFFSVFHSEPVASASIAQVYKARLKDGGLVAVKIQRPNTKEIFEQDFRVMLFISFIFDFFRLFSTVYAQEIVAEFISWTRSELDFTIEAKNAATLYDRSLEYPRTVIPRTYLELSTKKVLIQEFIEGGILADEYIQKKTEDKSFLISGIEEDEMANYLIMDILRQYFIDGFFHADPHPANLVFIPVNKLAFLDFGIIGRAKEYRLPYLKIIYGIACNDTDFISESLLEFGERLMLSDLETYLKRGLKDKERFEKISKKIKELILDDLKKEIRKIFDAWINSYSNPVASLQEKSAVNIFFKMVRVAEKFNVHFPQEMVLNFRMLSILDMVALQVSSRFDMMNALNAFFEEYPFEELERLMQKEADTEIGEKIISIDETLDWDSFQEILTIEKERSMAAKEEFAEMVLHYAERYSELRSTLRGLK